MKLDRYVSAALMGALLTILSEVVSLLLVAAGVGAQDLYRIDSLFITLNRPSVVFGFLVDFIVGGAVGFILFIFLEKCGSTNIVLKGLMISLFFWFLFKLYSTAIIEGKTVDIRPFETYYNHFICTVLYGLALGFLFKCTLFKRKA